MIPATTSAETFIGAGDLYRDGVLVGPTMEDNVFRVVQEKGSPKVNGTPGPIKGLDWITSETAELQVSIMSLSPETLATAIPGSTSVAGNASAAATTTAAALDGATAVGDVTFDVVDATGLIVGDLIQIGAAGAHEFRKITVVATNTLTVDYPLSLAHASADPVLEVTHTTLSADAEIGSTNLKVASVSGLAVGDYVRFGESAEAEVRQLTFVGTTGSSGTGISFDFPTAQRHRSGDYVFEQTDLGGSSVTSNAGTTRRIPASAYHEYELVVPGANGRELHYLLHNALVTSPFEVTASDDPSKPAAPRLTIQARWDESDGATGSPWEIVKVGATS
jgi:hypothetical protein